MKKSLFAIAAVPDAREQLSLKFLFEVVFRQPSLVVNGADALRALLEDGVQADLLIIGGISDAGEIASIVDFARKMNSDMAVVVLQNRPSAGFEAAAFKAGAADVVFSTKYLKDIGYRLRARMSDHPFWAGFDMETAGWELLEYFSRSAGLTAAESQILEHLLTGDDQIVTRDDLSLAIDSKPWSYGNRKFDVHIAKLRKKLRDKFGPQISVQTIRSVGYQLTLAEPDRFDVSPAR